MIAQGVLHGGVPDGIVSKLPLLSPYENVCCLTAADICCARHSASPAGLALCSHFSNVCCLAAADFCCARQKTNTA